MTKKNTQTNFRWEILLKDISNTSFYLNWDKAYTRAVSILSGIGKKPLLYLEEEGYIYKCKKCGAKTFLKFFIN